VDKCRIRSYQTIIFPINWKVALEAFVEGYHLSGTHPQLLRWGKPYLPALENSLARPAPRTARGPTRIRVQRQGGVFDPRKYVHDDLMCIHETCTAGHEEGARAADAS